MSSQENKIGIIREAYIGGKWVKGTTKTFPVYNPADGTIIADVTDCDSECVNLAIGKFLPTYIALNYVLYSMGNHIS